MITHFETNKVYMAKGLSTMMYADVAYSLLSELSKSEIDWGELPCTQSPLHVWTRDYMPLQVCRDRFVLFRYEPDYLNNYPEYKPQVDEIIGGLGVDVCHSSINLDGGNVISCGDKVIVTDKIFKENPQLTSTKLLDELSALLEAEIVLIP